MVDWLKLETEDPVTVAARRTEAGFRPRFPFPNLPSSGIGSLSGFRASVFGLANTFETSVPVPGPPHPCEAGLTLRPPPLS